MIAKSLWISLSEIAAVGSSMMMISASVATALAISTICFFATLKVADELLRVDGRLDALHHVDDLGYLVRPPEEAEGSVLHAQGQVFLDRQLVYDVQLLEEGAYPLLLGLFRGSGVVLLPVQ